MPASILDMFPLQEAPEVQPVEPDFERKLDKLQRIHQSMIVQQVKPGSSSNLVRPGEKYRRYKSEQEIPEKGRLFFKLAGEYKLID